MSVCLLFNQVNILRLFDTEFLVLARPLTLNVRNRNIVYTVSGPQRQNCVAPSSAPSELSACCRGITGESGTLHVLIVSLYRDRLLSSGGKQVQIMGSILTFAILLIHTAPTPTQAHVQIQNKNLTKHIHINTTKTKGCREQGYRPTRCYYFRN